MLKVILSVVVVFFAGSAFAFQPKTPLEYSVASSIVIFGTSYDSIRSKYSREASEKREYDRQQRAQDQKERREAIAK